MWYIPGKRPLDVLEMEVAKAGDVSLDVSYWEHLLDQAEEEWTYKDKRGAWAILWALSENPAVPLLCLEEIELGSMYMWLWNEMSTACHHSDTTRWPLPPTRQELAAIVQKKIKAKGEPMPRMVPGPKK